MTRDSPSFDAPGGSRLPLAFSRLSTLVTRLKKKDASFDRDPVGRRPTLPDDRSSAAPANESRSRGMDGPPRACAGTGPAVSGVRRVICLPGQGRPAPPAIGVEAIARA